MHNIIFSIRNVLLLSAVFSALLFFPFSIHLSSRQSLRRSCPSAAHRKYSRRLHSVGILPFIYFSHWMECSIPNDTTKELYYLCSACCSTAAAAAAVATALTKPSSQLLLLKLLLFASAVFPSSSSFRFYLFYYCSILFHFALCHC